MGDEEETGKVLEFKHTNFTILCQVKRDARKELIKLYYITAGFQDPDPPTLEQIDAFLDGLIEI